MLAGAKIAAKGEGGKEGKEGRGVGGGAEPRPHVPLPHNTRGIESEGRGPM